MHGVGNADVVVGGPGSGGGVAAAVYGLATMRRVERPPSGIRGLRDLLLKLAFTAAGAHYPTVEGEARVGSQTVRRVTGVVVGVVVAPAATPAVMFWLRTVVDQRGEQEVGALARRTVALADARIVSALASLDDLTMRGIDGCRDGELETLRQIAFANPWVKDVAVIGADGRALCGSSGIAPAGRRIVSSYHPNGERDLSIDVIRIGDGETLIGITRRAEGTIGFTALIPAAIFIAQASRDGGALNPHIQITANDGTAIVERGPAEANGGEQFVATRQSARYGLKSAISLPRAAFQIETSRLNEIAVTIGACVLALILGIVMLVSRRHHDDPIRELELAIAADEFVPYYQPVVDIRTGRLRGAEVLARWRKPDGSIVMPAAFIPMAESSRLIIPLTRALMRRVSKEAGPIVGLRPDIKLGFNLAAMHFLDDTIVDDVRDIFADSALSLRQVILEITERQPLQSLVGARKVIAGLQELGCSVAIDDVGTGHGGLSYILKLGADTIKIDKLFVDGIGTEHESTIILETLVDLARNMRMDVIAEGVENFEQMVKLRELGILAAQGHVFCPPLPGSSFLQLVEAIAPVSRGRVRRSEAETSPMMLPDAAAA